MNVGGHLLDVAALGSSVEIFDELIAHGARLEDSIALHRAASVPNNTRLMARLLELGVDINEPDHKGKVQNGTIGPPIFYAIRACDIPNIKFLVENGADLTVKGTLTPPRWTPVEMARTMPWMKEMVDYVESVSPKDD